MTKIKTEIFIICILWFTTITSWILGDYISIPFTIGIVGLALITLSIKKYYFYSSYALMLILLFSIFRLVVFSSITLHTLFLGISINLSSLILLLILAYKRRNVISEWFTDDSTEKKDNGRKVTLFKVQFQNLSDIQLINKLDNEDLVPEAIDAIKSILKERKTV
jgi:hypothetical protein